MSNDELLKALSTRETFLQVTSDGGRFHVRATRPLMYTGWHTSRNLNEAIQLALAELDSIAPEEKK